jgi:hypothetical protein
MIGGHQITVAWHVDNLKALHKQARVVDSFNEQMEAEFGKETPLNQSWGKVHDYLGMMLDFTHPG